MYAYSLLVESAAKGWEPVRPGPDLEIPSLAALKEQVIHDLGFLPGWMVGLHPAEYIQVEDDQQVGDVWFILDIEGSQDHVLPPLAQRIAFIARSSATTKGVRNECEFWWALRG